MIYPNWVSTSYSYDSVGQLTAILAQAMGQDGKGHGDTVNSFSYLLDPVGNRTSKTVGVEKRAIRYDYSYDALYQLTESLAVMDGKGKPFRRKIEGYTYDPVGNRLSGPFQSDTYTHNAVNQIITKGKTNYRYDLNGNLVARSNWTYEYDYENRLIKAVKTDHDEIKTVSFKHDPFGRRIEKKVEEIEEGKVKGKTYTYVYDNEDIILEYRVGSDEDDDGDRARVKVSRFVHGPGIDEPLAVEQKGKVYYYHADGLGSIVSLTDNKGRVVESFDYSAFGFMQRQGNEVKQPYAYTGREWDKELGLYYYRARYYDPVVGRFISKDPIGFAGGDVNLYRYVGNGPVNLVDPEGLFGVSGVIAGGLAGAYSGYISGLQSGNTMAGIVGGLAGAAVGGAVGYWLPSQYGGVVGGMVGGGVAAATAKALQEGPCAQREDIAIAGGKGMAGGAITGALGSAFKAGAAFVGATGPAVTLASAMATKPVGMIVQLLFK